MSTSDTKYFVCTLGEAAQDGINRPFSTVSALIDEQARTNPQLPAIAFYSVVEQDHTADFTPKVLTFKDIKIGILRSAGLLSKSIDLQKGGAVGLLAASSPEFFFSWLGCIWLGHPVLLIAPQCSAAAIAHICKACDVSVLLTDEKHQELAEKACQHASDTGQGELSCVPVPSTGLDDILDNTKDDAEAVCQYAKAESNDIAYLHHTSGTSSGLPKPIPQTHHGAVGVLPALNGKDAATFTTTPLYHGGPADIFRAWTSNAMIWLFPSKDVPITARNVTKCLRVAEETASSSEAPSVKYFTSVPYILQMMAEDEEGLGLLQNMDLVGVGGAALAAEVGDTLIAQGVNLVSRFGAAESGFLLSSHRDYDKDKAWQYLRHQESVKQLTFEPRDEDLYELVIGPDWPHMAKRNREDGSYATSDLFARHSDIPDAWRYHSRADSQLTLVTGKKFDPAPLEDAIVAASSKISDVLLFGNGKPYPGALVFRSKLAQDATSEDIISELVPVVERLNAESPSHARIPRNMLVMMPFIDTPLEKSSKGTILRKTAEESYADKIEASYNQIMDSASRDVPNEELPAAILDLVKSIVGEDQSLEPDADLFGQGVDSVACVQIRHGLSLLLPENAKKLPLTVVEDSRTVTGLAELVKSLRAGDETNTRVDQRAHIPDLVQQFSKLDSRIRSKERNGKDVAADQRGINVLLTGPTGSLGAHVLSSLLERPNIEHIYLLVRGASAQAARERVLKALSSRLLPITDGFDQKVTILQCKLSEADLGLESSDYKTLQNNVDLIFHLAWSVNFLLSLRSFTPHFAGIQNLLQLSLSSSKPRCPRLIFCSSVASVSALSKAADVNGDTNGHTKSPQSTQVTEQIIPSTISSGPTGYALSKLTAELLLSHIATTNPCLHKRITVIRVGQISADTRHGIWNKSEAYPQILASAKFTNGILPDLGVEEQLTWLPVDVAADAFVEACLTEEDVMGNIPTEHVEHKMEKKEETTQILQSDSNQETQIDTAAVRVLHLLNPDTSHTFTDFLNRLQDLKVSVAQSITTPNNPSETVLNSDTNTTDGASIEIVTASQWLSALESLQSNSTSNPNNNTTTAAQPLFRLLPFWKDAYSSRQPSPSPSSSSSTSTKKIVTPSPFEMHNSLLTMPSLTYWLGLNTLEGREARYGGKPEKIQGGDGMDGDRTGMNMIVDGEVNTLGRKDSGDRHAGKDNDKEDKDAQTELLRSEYVRKVWKWVEGNVP